MTTSSTAAALGALLVLLAGLAGCGGGGGAGATPEAPAVNDAAIATARPGELLGYVKGKLTIIYEILRELHRELADLPAGHITLLAHPDIAGLLIDEERTGIDELEQRYGRHIAINSRPGFHIEQFEIAVG